MIPIVLLILNVQVMPLPSEHWDAYFTINGKDETPVALYTKCKPSYYFREKNFNEFCSSTKEFLKSKTSFCLRTGLQTYDRCNSIIDQNIKYADSWEWNENL